MPYSINNISTFRTKQKHSSTKTELKKALNGHEEKNYNKTESNISEKDIKNEEPVIFTTVNEKDSNNYLLQKFLNQSNKETTFVKPPVPLPRKNKPKNGISSDENTFSDKTFFIGSPKIIKSKEDDVLSLNSCATYNIESETDKKRKDKPKNGLPEDSVVVPIGDIVVHNSPSNKSLIKVLNKPQKAADDISSIDDNIVTPFNDEEKIIVPKNAKHAINKAKIVEPSTQKSKVNTKNIYKSLESIKGSTKFDIKAKNLKSHKVPNSEDTAETITSSSSEEDARTKEKSKVNSKNYHKSYLESTNDKGITNLNFKRKNAKSIIAPNSENGAERSSSSSEEDAKMKEKSKVNSKNYHRSLESTKDNSITNHNFKRKNVKSNRAPNSEEMAEERTSSSAEDDVKTKAKLKVNHKSLESAKSNSITKLDFIRKFSKSNKTPNSEDVAEERTSTSSEENTKTKEKRKVISKNSHKSFESTKGNNIPKLDFLRKFSKSNKAPNSEDAAERMPSASSEEDTKTKEKSNDYQSLESGKSATTKLDFKRKNAKYNKATISEDAAEKRASTSSEEDAEIKEEHKQKKKYIKSVIPIKKVEKPKRSMYGNIKSSGESDDEEINKKRYKPDIKDSKIFVGSTKMFSRKELRNYEKEHCITESSNGSIEDLIENDLKNRGHEKRNKKGEKYQKHNKSISYSTNTSDNIEDNTKGTKLIKTKKKTRNKNEAKSDENIEVSDSASDKTVLSEDKVKSTKKHRFKPLKQPASEDIELKERKRSFIRKLKNAKSSKRDASKDTRESDNSIDQYEPSYEFFIGVVIYKTDHLLLNSFIHHPIVKVHIVDGTTGEYIRRSRVKEEMREEEYLNPIITKPFDLRERR